MENPFKALGHKIDEGVEAGFTAILYALFIKGRRIAARSLLRELIELDPERATDYQAALEAIKH